MVAIRFAQPVPFCAFTDFVGGPWHICGFVGQEVTAQYQCIYLAPDIVVLLLEVLEFCCKDPKSLTQIAERNGVLICCSQLHHSARRLKASRSTQVRLQCLGATCCRC